MKTLSVGSQGSEVRTLQEELKELGYLLGSVDGIFGSDTLQAVRAFQSANGLSVDGIAGSQTLSVLLGGEVSTSSPVTTTSDSFFPSNNMFSNIPKWALYAGGAAILITAFAMMNSKKGKKVKKPIAQN